MDGTQATETILLLPTLMIVTLLGLMAHILKDVNKLPHFTRCFSTNFLGSRLIGKIRSIRFVTMDIAIMIAVGGTVMAGQSDIEPERNSIHTIVAVKRDNHWYFTAFQNSRAQYIGRPEESRALTEELRQELLMASKRNK